MPFNFFNFMGNFGDQGDDPTRDDRKGVLGFLQGTGEGLVHSAERIVKTPASLVSQGVRGTVGLTKAGIKAATGDTEGAVQELQNLQESQKKSYVNQTYGSKHAGDTKGLGEAAGFGLDVATSGAGTLLKAAAKEPVFNFLEKRIGKVAGKIATEGIKGAGIGAAYGGSNALINNAKTPEDFAKEIAIGAGVGAVGGAGISAAAAGGRSIAGKIATPAYASSEAPLRLYRGDKNSAEGVREISHSPGRTLEVNNSQNDLLKQFATDGDTEAAALVGGNGKPTDFVKADDLIKKKLAGEYDTIHYANQDRPIAGSEYHDLNAPRGQDFYAADPALARLYARQNRGAKYTETPGTSQKAPTQLTDTPERVPQSALAELDNKMVKGIPTKEESAVNLSDVTPDTTSKVGEKVNSLYSKLTKGDDLPKRMLKIRQATTNRYAAVDEFTNTYEKLTGTTLAPEDDPGVRAALAAGAPDKIRARVQQLDEAVQGADPQAVKQLGVLRQMATDRSGIKNPLSPERISQAMAELEAKIGPEGMAKTEKAVANVQKIQREMLDYAQEFLGEDVVERIAGKNPNYFTKFDALDHLIDAAENIKAGGSFNHATQNAIQAAKEGFTGDMGDPFESMIRQWGKLISFNETNKVTQAMGRMADNLEKSAPDSGLAIKLRDADSVQKRMELYKENKLFKPVRDTLESAAKKSEKTYKTLAKEMRLIDKELGKKQKAAIVKDVKKGGDPDAIPAAKNLTREDVREIVQQSLDWKDTQFAQLENKLRGRSTKMDTLLDDIQLARDQASGITERMKGNKEQAKLLGDKPLPKGYEKLSYFNKGIKEEIAVPKDVADAMKNMNSKQADFITKAASFQTRVLRNGATALNVAFTAPNALRDIQTAMLTSQNQAAHEVMQNWIKGFGHAWKQDDLVKQFIDSGGGQSGFYGRSSGKVTDMAARIGETRDQKIGRTIKSPAELLKLPFKALEKVASSAEMATRLAEFEAAKKNGLSGEAAAYAGRNVSVDFNKAGTIGQIANQWVPFLNARLQGTLNSIQAIRRDPVRAGAVISTTVVAPVVATYLWNRENFSEVYDQIPDYVKENSFVFIYGDDKDENGNYTQVAKIPKGDVGKLFGNPLENLLDYAFQHNPKSLSQLAVDTASTLSPISFSREGEIDPGLAVAGVLPPAVRGTIENTANFNFFRGAPVVSQKLSELPANEQVGPNTSPVAKGVGAVTGTSPLKVDNFIQAVGGGLGQQIADPKKFVTAPGKTFSGAAGNETENRFYATLDKTKPLRASASKKINEAIKSGDMDLARELAADYNAELRKNFAKFKENYGKYASADLKDTYSKQKINLNRATIAQRTAAMKAQAKKERRKLEGV